MRPIFLPAARPKGRSKPGQTGEMPDLLNEYVPCPGEPLIQMIDIVKTFKTPAGEFSALKNVDACFYAGEFVSVVGKSGSGKSTLVNMLTGIDRPTSGIVRVGQTDIHHLNESQMSLWRGRNLGIVFQFFQLLPMLSLVENVLLPMDLAGLYSNGQREARALELLQSVDLAEFAHTLPDAVSGGQQQSAAIARALANDPPILIADEPTGNLDSRTAEAIFDLFANLAHQGKTIIMVTHDSALSSRTDRTMLLSDGELVNEHVARALPFLPHPRLLWLTHLLQTVDLLPGAMLTAPGLYVVLSGKVEIHSPGAPSGEAAFAVLGPGDYLSAIDLAKAGWSAWSLQAGKEEALQFLALNPAEFDRWIETTPKDHNRLVKAAEARWANKIDPASGGQI